MAALVCNRMIFSDFASLMKAITKELLAHHVTFD